MIDFKISSYYLEGAAAVTRVRKDVVRITCEACVDQSIHNLAMAYMPKFCEVLRMLATEKPFLTQQCLEKHYAVACQVHSVKTCEDRWC